MAEPEDSILIQKTRKGEIAAFEVLVRRYQDLVAGTAYGWLADPELARDVVQEVFLEAHLKLDQLQEPAAFRGWLRRIVIKQCDRITRRHTPVQTEFDDQLPDMAGVSSPADRAERSEVADQVRFAVAGLPRQEREVIALHYFAEATGPELADYLELPLSTVKKRLRSARARLKQHGERLMQETMDRMRPSQSLDLSREVRFFLALRAGDRTEVARLLSETPGLADARQQWAPDMVFKGLLPFATDATALITAVELDDLEMLKLLLAAGADVNGQCGCLTAETPLWAATLFNRVSHAKVLLEAGADPNLASMTGNYPLHLAAMRGSGTFVELLLAHGADPGLTDEGPRFPRPFAPRDGAGLDLPSRTAAQWARENGHDQIARQLDQAIIEPAPDKPVQGGIVRVSEQILHTGIKAIDLFTPLVRGQAVRVPFKAGVGMVVLLGELCSRFSRAENGAAVWTGFAQPPFDRKDWQAEMAEFGLQDQVGQYLASFNEAPETRRKAFQGGIDEALSLARSGRDVLVVVQTTDGFEGEVDAALLQFSGDTAEGSITSMVISSFPEAEGDIWRELSAPYAGQIVLDRSRARAHLFPAIDPAASLTGADEFLQSTHRRLAERAARTLADYRSQDPDFENLSEHSNGPAALLLRYLCQPFQVTEPFTGRSGEWVSRSSLLEEVAAIVGDAHQ